MACHVSGQYLDLVTDLCVTVCCVTVCCVCLQPVFMSECKQLLDTSRQEMDALASVVTSAQVGGQQTCAGWEVHQPVGYMVEEYVPVQIVEEHILVCIVEGCTPLHIVEEFTPVVRRSQLCGP